nr:MAG: RNA-dependent RNA polymerase [Wufeng shrew picorna-like virus 15]
MSSLYRMTLDTQDQDHPLAYRFNANPKNEVIFTGYPDDIFPDDRFKPLEINLLPKRTRTMQTVGLFPLQRESHQLSSKRLQALISQISSLDKRHYHLVFDSGLYEDLRKRFLQIMQSAFPKAELLDFFRDRVNAKYYVDMKDSLVFLLMNLSYDESISFIEFVACIATKFTLTVNDVQAEVIYTLGSQRTPYTNESIKAYRRDIRKNIRRWYKCAGLPVSESFRNHETLERPPVLQLPECITRIMHDRKVYKELYLGPQIPIAEKQALFNNFDKVAEDATVALAATTEQIAKMTDQVTATVSQSSSAITDKLIKTLTTVDETLIKTASSLEVASVGFITRASDNVDDQTTQIKEQVLSSMNEAMSILKDTSLDVKVAIKATTDVIDSRTERIAEEVKDCLKSVTKTFDKIGKPAFLSVSDSINAHKVAIISNLIDLANTKSVTSIVNKVITLCSLAGLEEIATSKILKLFVDNRAPRAELQSLTPQNGVKLLAVIAAMFGRTLTPSKIVEKLTISLASTGRVSDGFDQIWVLLEDLLDSLGIVESKRLKQEREVLADTKICLDNLAEYEAVMKTSAARYCTKSYYDKFTKDFSSVKNIMEIYRLDKKVSHHLMADVRSLFLRYSNLSTSIEATRKSSGSRVVPFAICLLGSSQIGKTRLTDNFVKLLRVHIRQHRLKYYQADGTLKDEYKFLQDLDNWQEWHQNLDDDYDQGYCAQEVHIVNDGFAKTDDKDHAAFLQFISSNVYLTKQAELCNKGMPYSSKLILTSANQFPFSSKTIKNVEAVANRFTIIHVRMKQGATVPSKTDFDPTFSWLEFGIQEGRDAFQNYNSKIHQVKPVLATLSEVFDITIDRMMSNQRVFDSMNKYFSILDPSAKTESFEEFDDHALWDHEIHQNTEGLFHTFNVRSLQEELRIAPSNTPMECETIADVMTHFGSYLEHVPMEVPVSHFHTHELAKLLELSKSGHVVNSVPGKSVNYLPRAETQTLDTDEEEFASAKSEITDKKLDTKGLPAQSSLDADEPFHIWTSFDGSQPDPGMESDLFFPTQTQIPRHNEPTQNSVDLNFTPFDRKKTIGGSERSVLRPPPDNLNLTERLYFADGLLKLDPYTPPPKHEQEDVFVRCSVHTYLLTRDLHKAPSVVFATLAPLMVVPDKPSLRKNLSSIRKISYKSNGYIITLGFSSNLSAVASFANAVVAYRNEATIESQEQASLNAEENSSLWSSLRTWFTTALSRCTQLLRSIYEWLFGTTEGFSATQYTVLAVLTAVLAGVAIWLTGAGRKIYSALTEGSELSCPLSEVSKLLNKVEHESLLDSDSIELPENFEQIKKLYTARCKSCSYCVRTDKLYLQCDFSGLDPDYDWFYPLIVIDEISELTELLYEVMQEKAIPIYEFKNICLESGSKQRTRRVVRESGQKSKTIRIRREAQSEPFSSRLPTQPFSTAFTKSQPEYASPGQHIPGSKPKELKQVRTEAFVDPQAPQALNKILEKHSVKILNEKGVNFVHGLASGNYVIFPAHALTPRSEKLTFSYIRKTIKENKIVEALVEGPIENILTHPDPAYDIAIGTIKEGFPDISKHLLTEESFNKETGKCIFHSKQHNLSVVGAFTYNDTHTLLLDGVLTHQKHVVVTRSSIATSLCTAKGDCGLPLVLVNPKIKQKLIGFHINGADDFSVSQIVTLKTFHYLKSLLPVATTQSGPKVCFAEFSYIPHETDVPEIFFSNFTYPIVDDFDTIPYKEEDPADLPQGNITYLGSSAREYRATNYKTNLKRHPLYDSFRVKSVPSALNSRLVEDPSDLLVSGGYPSILVTQTSKYGQAYRELSDEDNQWLDETTHEMIQYFSMVLQDHDIGMTSLDEVVNGIPEDPSHTRIDLRTSPGVPWSDLFQSKKLFSVNKDDYWSFNDSPQTKFLLSQVERKLEYARHGYRTFSVWKDTLKDEARPIPKVAKGKTRVFVAVPYETHLTMLMHYQRFKHYWQVERSKLFHGVGVDPQSPEWSLIYHAMSAMGDRGFDADFASFDGRLLRKFMFAALSIINNTIYLQEYGKLGKDKANENRNVREILSSEIVDTIHISNSTIYMTHQGNPSGNPITTPINCIVNLLYHRYCFWKITGLGSLAAFKKYMYFICFGDDVIVVPSIEYAKFLTLESFQKIMNEIGQDYTPGDKEEMYQLKPLKHLKFLKRLFYLRNGLVFAPLDRDSIEQQFNWSIISADQTSSIESQLKEALIEASAWGAEYYSYFINNLRKTATEKRLQYQYLWLTYSDAVTFLLYRQEAIANKNIPDFSQRVSEAK